MAQGQEWNSLTKRGCAQGTGWERTGSQGGLQAACGTGRAQLPMGSPLRTPQAGGEAAGHGAHLHLASAEGDQQGKSLEEVQALVKNTRTSL